MKHWPVATFLIALATRFAYLAVIYDGAESLLMQDSHTYRILAQIAKPLSGGPWMPDPARMPLYPLFLDVHEFLLGTDAPLYPIITQVVADSIACVLIGRLAECLDERLAPIAGLLAALNPTQIVLAALVLTDSLFLFFVCLMLLGCARWLAAPRWRSAVLAGAAGAFALWTRAVIWPFLAVLPVILVALQAWKHRLVSTSVVQAGTIGALAALAAMPIVLANARAYGAWQISAQNGEQALLWIVPLVQEAKDGTPWEQSVATLQAKLAQRHADLERLDPFALSAARMALAREELGRLGLAPIIKAWAFGAAINLASPAIILSPPIARLPRTGFYATPGATKAEKIWNFLWHGDNPLYGRILVVSTAGAVAIVGFALAGVAIAARRRRDWSLLLLLALWAGFVLIISGPVASAKYRLPIEPVLVVLTSFAVAALVDIWRRRDTYAD